MANEFPKTIFVRIEQDENAEDPDILIADKNISAHGDIDETVKVGKYELKQRLDIFCEIKEEVKKIAATDTTTL